MTIQELLDLITCLFRQYYMGYQFDNQTATFYYSSIPDDLKTKLDSVDTSRLVSPLNTDRKNWFHILFERMTFSSGCFENLCLSPIMRNQPDFKKYIVERAYIKEHKESFDNLVAYWKRNGIKPPTVKDTLTLIISTLLKKINAEDFLALFSAQDNEGNTPLHYAAISLNYPQLLPILEKILAMPLDSKNKILSIKNLNNQNPIHKLAQRIATLTNDCLLAKVLSSSLSALVISDNNRMTPLHYLLIPYGVNNFECLAKTIEDENDQTSGFTDLKDALGHPIYYKKAKNALHLVARSKNLANLKRLCLQTTKLIFLTPDQIQAQIAATDDYSWNAFHYSVYFCNSPDIFNELVSQFPEAQTKDREQMQQLLSARTEEGWTVLEVACAYNADKITIETILSLMTFADLVAINQENLIQSAATNKQISPAELKGVLENSLCFIPMYKYFIGRTSGYTSFFASEQDTAIKINDFSHLLENIRNQNPPGQNLIENAKGSEYLTLRLNLVNTLSLLPNDERIKKLNLFKEYLETQKDIEPKTAGRILTLISKHTPPRHENDNVSAVISQHRL